MGTSAEPGRRRIWELDLLTRSLVTGALMGREAVEALLACQVPSGEAPPPEAELRARLASGCASPSALAEAVEGALDRCAAQRSAECEGCPMIRLIEWWSRHRERISPTERAEFLWCLARDPRPHLAPLTSKVRADLLGHSLAFLARHRDDAVGDPDRAGGQGGPLAGSPGAR